MAGVMAQIGSTLADAYSVLTSALSPELRGFVGLFILSMIIVAYSIFIWKFYRFIATKNLIKLNLNRYNTTDHPTLFKLVASGFYLLEYLIILPFLVLFWYGVFTIFLIILTEGLSTGGVLLVSATIIASVRLTAYYKEDIAKELAKLLPFTLLGIAITKPGFFDVTRIFTHIKGMPAFFDQVFIYFIFILIIEVVLRLFDLVLSSIGLNNFKKNKEDEE